MRKIISLFVFFQFLFLPCFGQVVINEIMYNPSTEQGKDDYSEWIEIFNPTNESINLSSWELCGDELLAGYINYTNSGVGGPYLNESTNLSPNQYAIITDGESGTEIYQFFNVSNDSLALHVNPASLCGGGLKNTGETINLSNGTYTEIVNYNNSAGWPKAKDGYSLQRINSSQNLSNNSTNWIAFPPSPGRKNFYENATLELLDISAEEIYVNETTNISIKIANRGMKNATNISVNLSINNTYNDSGIINITGINITEIPFNWTFNETGNYTICAEANNSLCKNFEILPLENASISLNITEEDEKIIFYTNLSNASCTINYNISVGNFIIDSGKIEKEAFQNASLDIGFGKFKVCANMILHNFNNINKSDNSINKNITINPGDKKRYRLRSWIDKEKYELNSSINWIIQLFIPLNGSTTGNLTLKLGKNKKSGSGFKYFNTTYENNSFNITQNGTTISGNFTIPENYFEGIYKLRAKFKYGSSGWDYLDSSDNGIFWLNGLKDLGDLNVSILGELPETARFGDIIPIFLKVNANNYAGSLGCRARINKDLSISKTRYASLNYEMTYSFSRGETKYIFVPLIIKPNCNDHYHNSEYRIVIETKESNNGKTKKELSLNISGKANNLCQYISKGSTTKSKEKSKTLEIEILNLTKTLARNQEFTTRVKLKNNFGKKVLFEIYSYIFDGSNCLTGNWRANLKKIKLNKDEERIINLTNKVEKEAKPWYYSFRIRIKLKDGSNIDKTEQIKITNKILKNKKEMKETPNLKIWNDTKIRINLSNCEGCKMIIVGPNISVITGRKYRVFEDFGKYEVFVIKEGIILNQTYFWEEKIVSNKTEKNLTEKGKSKEENKTIGKFSENKSKSLVDKVVSTLQNLVSPLIEAMKLSIK